MVVNKRLRRFFSRIPLLPEVHDVILPPDEGKHLSKVLRLNLGDECLISDGCGHEARARVQNIKVGGEVSLCILDLVTHEISPSRPYLKVYQALPQRGKMDFLIEKFQELGVEECFPIRSEYSEVPPPTIEKGKNMLLRWEKKAQEASKQSGNPFLLKVEPIQDLSDSLESLSQREAIVVFHPIPEAIAYQTWLDDIRPILSKQPRMSLNLFIGPEGGFSERDITLIKKQGQRIDSEPIIVSLGSSILRLETASLAVISTLRLMLP